MFHHVTTYQGSSATKSSWREKERKALLIYPVRDKEHELYKANQLQNLQI